MGERPTTPGAVLVVDDEAGVRELTTRWLGASGYEVVAAESAGDALGLLEDRLFPVALCDIRMPGRDGFWLLEQLRRRSPETALILSTGLQDVGSAVTSLRLGVIDYLMKPFSRDRLREAVRRGIAWHHMALAGRSERDRLRADVVQRRGQLAGALRALPVDSRAMLEAMLKMLTLKEPSLLDHGRRVAGIACAIAAQRCLDARAIDLLERAALVHDIPKLIVPDSILGKGGPLLPQELDVVRVGPTLGHELLVAVDYLEQAATIVRARYEWWDGSGYPCGLEGEAIPIESRILAVADTYDTLVQPRRYRAAMDEHAAAAEILRCRGTQFDPSVVDAFQQVFAGSVVHARVS